jgi:hypothetical protein
VNARRLTHRRSEVRRERLRTAEERADPDLHGDRHSRHRLLEERRHPVPVRRQRPEREVGRDPVDPPGRGRGLEQADHHAAAFFAEVAVRRRVLEDRGVGVDALDGVGDEVVVLGGLVGDDQPVALPELAGPHAGAVDDVLALDGLPCRPDARDGSAGREHVGDGDPLDEPDAEVARAPGQRHRQVDGVDPTVAGDEEPREQVVRTRPREQLGDLGRRDLVHLEPEVTLEGGDPAVLLEPVAVGGGLDHADRSESGRLPGLCLEPRVEVAGVEPDVRAGLRGRPEAGHQAGRVPGRPGGEAVPLQHDDIGPSGMGQVVGHRGADDPATDDDDPGPVGQFNSHPHNLDDRRRGHPASSYDATRAQTFSAAQAHRVCDCQTSQGGGSPRGH